ncbi:hypothetical protein AALO_G00005330 [Alosa alosa]|uniref:Uncharacterized protein n=2 Tax=Alosa TaxID=34772 RepID=A0AAV6HE21_9TELE|nr:hypothetical protein AALO_G00005330 [Alosa alosa]
MSCVVSILAKVTKRPPEGWAKRVSDEEVRWISELSIEDLDISSTNEFAMVLRRLLYALINNAQLVEKLSESRPIRRAAQITAFAITKAQIAGKDATNKLMKSDTLRQIKEETGRVPRDVGEMGRRAGRIRDSFMKEVKEGMRDASRQIKDRDK